MESCLEVVGIKPFMSVQVASPQPEPAILHTSLIGNHPRLLPVKRQSQVIDHLLLHLLAQGLLFLIQHIEQGQENHREKTTYHTNTRIRLKIERQTGADLSIFLHLFELAQGNRTDIVGCSQNGETRQQLSVLLKRQELKVVAGMLGDTLNAELETWSLLLDAPGTDCPQLFPHRLNNLLRCHRELQRLALDVHHAIREEQVRPDALTPFNKEANQPVINHIGKQAAHFAQLVVTENQFIIA